MASRYPIATLTKRWAPAGLLFRLSGSRQKSQVPTFYVKIDWEGGWPIDTLMQFEHSLGPPLGSRSCFLSSKGLVEQNQVPISYFKMIGKQGSQSIPYCSFNAALGPHWALGQAI